MSRWGWLGERWARPLTDDEIASAVLDLCKAVLSDREDAAHHRAGPRMDRTLRDPAHDLAVYGHVIHSPADGENRGCAPSSGEADTGMIDP